MKQKKKRFTISCGYSVCVFFSLNIICQTQWNLILLNQLKFAIEIEFKTNAN